MRQRENTTNAAGQASSGEPDAQRERSVVANTATADPNADQESWKRYVLEVRDESCGEQRHQEEIYVISPLLNLSIAVFALSVVAVVCSVTSMRV